MESVFVKRDEEKERIKEDGKVFRLIQRSGEMQAIIAELDIDMESDLYLHGGEELHLVLSGEIEYAVGTEVFRMEVGDTLWHPSYLPHSAKNVGDEKAMYITISTPPTFMLGDIGKDKGFDNTEG